jgi:hypothetical protein
MFSRFYLLIEIIRAILLRCSWSHRYRVHIHSRIFEFLRNFADPNEPNTEHPSTNRAIPLPRAKVLQV